MLCLQGLAAFMAVACGSHVETVHVGRPIDPQPSSVACRPVVCPPDTQPTTRLVIWDNSTDWEALAATEVPGLEVASFPREEQWGDAHWCEEFPAPHRRHGPARFCDASGRIRREGRYEHGEKTGSWTEFDVSGSAIGTASWTNDRLAP